jgi:hypothetical protein
MNRTVKTFLVWLLMLVLPLHAVAANVGMSCAPAERQAAHGMAAVMAEVSTAHHGHEGDAGDAHAHHGGGHASDASPAVHDGDASAKDPGKKAHSSCSACSALCIGAVAPPSALLPLPAFDGSDAVALAPTRFAAGFIPDGLQRPPRHPSA